MRNNTTVPYNYMAYNGFLLGRATVGLTYGNYLTTDANGFQTRVAKDVSI